MASINTSNGVVVKVYVLAYAHRGDLLFCTAHNWFGQCLHNVKSSLHIYLYYSKYLCSRKRQGSNIHTFSITHAFCKYSFEYNQWRS